jgi:hypothetical protein
MNGLVEIVKSILTATLPFIMELIKSKVVPAVKRRAYEKLDEKADNLILDLAQNAAKIKDADDSTKLAAYTEGTKLGLEAIRAIAEKLNKAADEIEKAL